MLFKSLVFLAAVAFVCEGMSPNGDKYLASVDSRFISPSIAEDARLDFVGLATKYGYPVEAHTVQTEDGYLLTAHRINGKARQRNRPVVLVMHGLLCSSADWITTGPDNGLGYYLADEGFDVWLGNARGNFYSRRHVSLNPDKDPAFWKFSWHEMGYYDLPALIDYILAKTGQTQMHYIGHSQGGTSFFVMASMRKEYNGKIKSMHALAPAVFISNLKSPLSRILLSTASNTEGFAELVGANELLPSTKLMSLAGELLCKENSVFQPVCTNIMFLLCGYSPELLNSTILPVILSHTPAGSSSRQLAHYGQIYMSAAFRMYDEGLIGNLAAYGFISPPDYNLSSVSVPVALHHSTNDWLVSPEDVALVHGALGNSVGRFLVPHPQFNHLDFMWAIDVRSLVYDRVVNMMKAYN